MSNAVKPRGLVTHSLDMSAVEIVRARRACTVPQQLLKSRELPALPNTRTVPKRYEETKPVKVQNFTHQRIIDLGNLINKQAKEESVKLRQSAVEKAIADTWETAEEFKVLAIKEALEKAQVQHEKQLRKLSRQHDRALAEQAMAIEMRNQNNLREMIEEERTQAAANLKAAVEEVEARCAVELEKAVADARQKEQQVADGERKQLLLEAADKLQATEDTLNAQRSAALEELVVRKDSERYKAVQEAICSEQEVATKNTIALQQQHAIEMKNLDVSIVRIERSVQERDRIIEKVQKKREQLYDELVKVQADYQSFIDKHPMFDPGQTKYLLRELASNPNIINPYRDPMGPDQK